MPFHLTIETLIDDGLTVEQYAAAVQALKPATVQVDCGGGIGRTLLASLQSRGIPATALEKRPRPTLPEVQRAEEESRKAAALKDELQQCQREKGLLQDHLRDLRILIAKLDD